MNDILYEAVITLFMAQRPYDDNDEKAFKSDRFREILDRRLPLDDDFGNGEECQEYIAAKVAEALNEFQYGITSDEGDIKEIKADLVRRSLYDTRTYDLT